MNWQLISENKYVIILSYRECINNKLLHKFHTFTSNYSHIYLPLAIRLVLLTFSGDRICVHNFRIFQLAGTAHNIHFLCTNVLQSILFVP